MLTIIYSTRKENPEFTKQLLNSCFHKNVQIIEIVNNGIYSLSEAYNIGIEQSIFDIVICCHDDIFLSKNFDKAIIKDFKENPEFGIIGKAGAIRMDESGIYWTDLQSVMVGQVYHQIGDQPKYLSSYSSKFNNLIEVVTIDGLFMAFDKTKIHYTFDESVEGFHFYDHNFCISNFNKNKYWSGIQCKIGVTFSFDITHKSMGETNDAFDVSRLKFVMKYNDYLPIELPEKKIYWDNKNPVIKDSKQELISIIICHIHKNDLLFTCVKSLLQSTTYKNIEIIIADTGSNDETKEEIKGFIKDDNRIKLVEYDYYNFAKINNDVVKYHLSKDSKFILFLNNDVEFLPDNDAISRLYETLISKNNTFGVGPRMYFSLNGPIQHAGHLAYIDRNNTFQITHSGLHSYYNYNRNNREVVGNTGACLLVRRAVFEKLGMFVETTSCFEDCLICMAAIKNNYFNVFTPNAVILHKESSTRNLDPDNLKKLQYDYQTFLLPYVQQNFEKLKGYTHQVN